MLKLTNLSNNTQVGIFPMWTLNNQHAIRKIKGIAIPIHDNNDSFCWELNSSGELSTNSATWVAHGYESYESREWPYKWIWKIDAILKVKNIFVAIVPQSRTY